MGIGDWGLGIGDWAQSPIPNPHFILDFINILNYKKIIFFHDFKKILKSKKYKNIFQSYYIIKK